MIHPLDGIQFLPERALIADLFERFSLEALVEHHEAAGDNEPERDMVMSTQLRLTPILAPRLCALFDEVRQRLRYEDPVELFVQSEANVNGFSLHSTRAGKPHIVSLTSGMIERMTDDELRFVMGHELGHLHYNHHRPRLIYLMLGEDEEGESRIPPLLQRRMESWERLAELSADRVGFVAVEGRLEPVVSAFFKLTSGLGPEHLKFDINAFLAQLADLQEMKRRDVMATFSHPVTPVRVRALQLYGMAGGGLLEIDGHPGLTEDAHGEVDRHVAELAQLMEFEVTEPLEVQARDFLLAAGLLAADADGAGMSAEEHELLVQVLLPMTSDPEEQLARIHTRAQARDMLKSTAAWLRANAGEERFVLFRQIGHLVAVDGVLNPGEKAFMLSVAKALAIPPKSATEMLYEVLTEYLRSRPWDRKTVFKTRPRKRGQSSKSGPLEDGLPGERTPGQGEPGGGMPGGSLPAGSLPSGSLPDRIETGGTAPGGGDQGELGP